MQSAAIPAPCLLPTARRRLPTAYCLPPTAYFLLLRGRGEVEGEGGGRGLVAILICNTPGAFADSAGADITLFGKGRAPARGHADGEAVPFGEDLHAQ